MKLASSFMIIIVAALMFLLPQMKNESRAFERQAQEEAPMEEILDEYNTFKITFRVTRPEDDSIADIIWMKRAAEVAQNAGVPYFNVLKQEISKRYVKDHDRELSVVEGVIQLDNDPMRAEYDAYEIESLVLTDYP